MKGVAMEALNGEPRDSEFQTDENRAVLDAVAFAGDALAPFFLQDPLTGDAGASFEAMAALDPAAAAAEWPFAEEGEAREALGLMVAGLAGGAGDEGLAWEYRRLFVGPAPKPAPPWGSVYTDRECVVFGASTLELRAWMRGRGVARLGAGRSPRTTSASCWPSWRGSRATGPPTSTSTCGGTCSPGRRTSWASWPGRRATPSTRGSRA